MSAPLVVVLAGVRTVTHLVYASSYLRHLLRRQQRAIRLTVLGAGPALGHPGDPAATARHLLHLLPDDERLRWSFADPGQPWWHDVPADAVLLSIGAPATRALARLVTAHRGRRPQVVVVDEGIGSYGTWRTRRAAYLRQGGAGPWSTVRAVTVASAARFVPDLRWSLYSRSGSGWVVHDVVADEFRLRLGGGPPAPRTAVYLTQPWSHLGVMSREAYAAHLESVRLSCATVGLGFTLRPHPWEDPDRYAGLPVLSARGPAELDREVTDATVVIGANSTALLNVRAIHGTRVARVTAPELARLDAGLSRRQRSLLDAFLPAAVTVDRLAAGLPLQ